MRAFNGTSLAPSKGVRSAAAGDVASEQRHFTRAGPGGQGVGLRVPHQLLRYMSLPDAHVRVPGGVPFNLALRVQLEGATRRRPCTISARPTSSTPAKLPASHFHARLPAD